MHLSKNICRVTRTEGSLYFFIRQTEEIKNRLSKVEEGLKEAKTSSGMVSIEGQRRILEDHQIMIRTRSLANNSLLQASQAKLKELSSILDSFVNLDRKRIRRLFNLIKAWNLLREKLFDLQIRGV